MAEVSLVKQLSGAEALDSMLFELRKKLKMNGRFSPHMAYPGYRAILKLEFYPAASFVPHVEQVIEVEFVPVDVNNEEAREVVVSRTALVDETVEIPVRPPNQVREDSDMPTPVLVMDEKGNPVEKWVHRKGKIPKNKVKGGKAGNMEGYEPAVTMVPTDLTVA
jgi:hypothetical protein